MHKIVNVCAHTLLCTYLFYAKRRNVINVIYILAIILLLHDCIMTGVEAIWLVPAPFHRSKISQFHTLNENKRCGNSLST